MKKIMNELRKLREDQLKLEEKIREKTEETFKLGVDSLFEENSKLESFSWIQTDIDLEEEFLIKDFCVNYHKIKKLAYEFEQEDLIEIVEDISFSYLIQKFSYMLKEKTPIEEIIENCYLEETPNEFIELCYEAAILFPRINKFFTSFEKEDYRFIFGENLKVSVFRNKIDIEELSEDYENYGIY